MHWPESDPSVERQARYVSAVAASARRGDAKRLHRIITEQAYLAELRDRTAIPRVAAPSESLAWIAEEGDSGEDRPGSRASPEPGESWVPDDLGALLGWIRRAASELAYEERFVAAPPFYGRSTTAAMQ